jgi:hypothetical protein
MLGQTPPVGLVDNMIYDIIPIVQGAVGNAIVNATIFEVRCQALPNVTATGVGSLTQQYNSQSFAFPFNISDDLTTIAVGPPSTSE